MRDMVVDRYWIDSLAIVGDGSNEELDFRIAVHMTLYWGQDMTSALVCDLAHPPKRLSERLRRGMPLSLGEIAEFGEGRWPLPDEAFSLERLPATVDDAVVKEGGSVSWRLSPHRLFLRKLTPMQGMVYVGEVVVDRGPPVSIRQRMMRAGLRGPVPGIAKNLKLISAMRGLYDGGKRMLPVPMGVETEHDVEQLVSLLESDTRMQPVVVVAQARGEQEDAWRSELAEYAKEAFTVQHVAAVSLSGIRNLRDVLGEHALSEGAIKTFRQGFSQLDLVTAHPISSYQTVLSHEHGRAGLLKRWRIRTMGQDAWNRREDPTIEPQLGRVA